MQFCICEYNVPHARFRFFMMAPNDRSIRELVVMYWMATRVLIIRGQTSPRIFAIKPLGALAVFFRILKDFPSFFWLLAEKLRLDD